LIGINFSFILENAVDEKFYPVVVIDQPKTRENIIFPDKHRAVFTENTVCYRIVQIANLVERNSFFQNFVSIHQLDSRQLLRQIGFNVILLSKDLTIEQNYKNECKVKKPVFLMIHRAVLSERSFAL
jgi:hypothetical protein